MRDLVVGIDSSTTATKAIAFDRAGVPLHEARAAYPTKTPLPGYFEQDPADWTHAAAQALRSVAQAVGAGRIAALAIGQQRETFALIDEEGRALRPGILWLDERARREVAELSARLGRDTIRDISGKPPDPTPSLYALAWLATHEPETMARAHAVVDVHGYLVRAMTGRVATSLPCADPLGIIDLARGTWDPSLVAAAGLRPDQLPALAAPGTVIGTLTADFAQAAGISEGLPLIAGAGDGQMAGLGLGAIEPGLAYLSLGTGVVTGMHVAAMVTADAYRTLASPTGRGFIVETVLRSGMTLADWVARLTSGRADGETLTRLESEAAALPVGAQGLMLMPYWAGVMNPYWDEAARGAVLGFGLNHGPAHLFRAVLEGIAMEQAVATAALEASVGRRAERFIVAGGGVKSRLLMSIMAATLQRPLAPSPVSEAVAAGAAMLAAAAIGWHPSIEAAMQTMAQRPERAIEPDPELVSAYAPRVEVYRDIFGATQPVFARLAALSN